MLDFGFLKLFLNIKGTERGKNSDTGEKNLVTEIRKSPQAPRQTELSDCRTITINFKLNVKLYFLAC